MITPEENIRLQGELLGIERTMRRCLDLAIQTAATVGTEAAREHLLYGLARRLRMITRSFSTITEIADPNRETPLDGEEQAELTLHLNSFYFHLRGAIDNIAWAIATELKVLGEPNEQDHKYRRNVSLFGKTFRQGIAGRSPTLDDTLKDLIPWWLDLRELRDPIAHRIPLYAVPSLVSPTEASELRERTERVIDAIVKKDYDECDELQERIQSIGRYVPIFAGSFRQPAAVWPVFPQVVSDLGNLSRVIQEGCQVILQDG